MDLVRATAITMVVLSHVDFIFQKYDIPGIGFIGIEGVEVFFVLSGFLIGRILIQTISNTNFSSKEIFLFWLRRWLRTLPLYYALLIINAIILVSVGYNLPNELWKYVFFLQNLMNYQVIFFLESWSLSVEEYAYLLMPIVIYMLANASKNRAKAFLLASTLMIVIFFVSKLYYYVAYSDEYQTLAFWNTHLKSVVIYRLDAIFYGFLMIYFFEEHNRRIQELKVKLFVFGILLLTSISFIIPVFGIYIESNPFYWNVLYLPLNSIGIALMLPQFYYLKKPSKKLADFIEKISKYSYSMYLLHYTFLLFLLEILFDFESRSLLALIFISLFYLIMVYILSKWVYTYFEKPILKFRDTRYPRQANTLKE